jgi:hypothetical protein
MYYFALVFLLPLYCFFSHIWALWQKFLPPGNSDSPISSYSPLPVPSLFLIGWYSEKHSRQHTLPLYSPFFLLVDTRRNIPVSIISPCTLPFSFWLILGETFPSAYSPPVLSLFLIGWYSEKHSRQHSSSLGWKAASHTPGFLFEYVLGMDFAATFRWQSDSVSSWQYKIIGAPKKFKKWPVLYLGLKLTIHVVKGQIHIMRKSL